MKKVIFFVGSSLILCSLCVGRARADDRAALGVVLSDQPVNPAGGAIVIGVMSGSPAFQAGIQPGDRITAVDGQKVSDYHDLMRIVAGKSLGSQVKLDIARGNWRATSLAYLGSSLQVFQGQSLTQPWTASPNIPVGEVPAWNQPPSWRPRPGWPYYPAERWRTHPHDDLMTSLYNSNF